MVWARLDDAILDNPKIAKAGVYGFALHVAAITWCCRNLTDGYIPYSRVTALLTLDKVLVDTLNPMALVDESNSMGGETGLDPLIVADHLVTCGLWEARDGGYMIHDFLEYNPSRAEVVAKQNGAAARQKKRRDKVRESHSTSQGTSRATSHSESRVSSRPPGPDPLKKEEPLPQDLSGPPRARRPALVTTTPATDPNSAKLEAERQRQLRAAEEFMAEEAREKAEKEAKVAP